MHEIIFKQCSFLHFEQCCETVNSFTNNVNNLKFFMQKEHIELQDLYLDLKLLEMLDKDPYFMNTDPLPCLELFIPVWHRHLADSVSMLNSFMETHWKARISCAGRTRRPLWSATPRTCDTYQQGRRSSLLFFFIRITSNMWQWIQIFACFLIYKCASYSELYRSTNVASIFAKKNHWHPSKIINGRHKQRCAWPTHFSLPKKKEKRKKDGWVATWSI